MDSGKIATIFYNTSLETSRGDINMAKRLIEVSKHLISYMDDEENHVKIDRSVSCIYVKDVKGLNTHYRALTYQDGAELKVIEKYIRGTLIMDISTARLLQTVVIRFGWLDKNLVQTDWFPLIDLADKFVNKTLIGSEKSKFTGVLRQLSMGAKEAREFHEDYNPIQQIVRILRPIPAVA